MSSIKPPKVSRFYSLLIVRDDKARVESFLITVMSLIQSPVTCASPGLSHHPQSQTNATNTAFSPLNPCKITASVLTHLYQPRMNKQVP